jgi:hypothetical protein
VQTTDDVGQKWQINNISAKNPCIQRVNEAAPKELSDELQIPRPMINQVLYRLMELEKIERIGLGRATRYRLK